MADGKLIPEIDNSEDEVQRIKSMVSGKALAEAERPGGPEQWVPAYGDLTALNSSRLILDSVGSSLLSDIVRNFVNLLGTSCVVSEKNGDYALRMLSSDWCRFLDQASGWRAGTPDNREALESGKWHCYESYWKEAARRAIETNTPVDAACRGGMRLFSAPICAGKEPAGSITIGYGDPLHDPAKRSELAAAFGVRVDELCRQSESHEVRPPFVVDWAKQQLLHLARLMGEIVERKQAERALRRNEEKFRALFDYAKDAVFHLRPGRPPPGGEPGSM